jgi:hypothetical protein
MSEAEHLQATIDRLTTDLADERRISSVWAARAKDAEQRALAAEGERRAFSKRVDELEAMLMRSPPIRFPSKIHDQSLNLAPGQITELPVGIIRQTNVVQS